MASSSSCPPRNAKKLHDVFLSFRGEDTRDNFTSHLHYVLSLKGIKTFVDDQLIRGDNISRSLLDTIEASSISIIIFSERYASSRWCLDELLKILECKHDYGQIVIPVFYRVDPSHVRWKTGTFGDYFSELGERYPEKMQRWGNALTEAANLSGFDSHVIRPESKLIEAIANGVLKRLDATFQSENKGLVGVAWRIKEIESLLCIRSAGVYVLGIWGIGGIGKTTIAGAVFNKISRCFEGSYFALDVREAEETGRIKDLQKELLSKLLNDGNARNVESQLNRLARKKVLLVFDDVNHPGQIESLIGCLDELASGSRVIITTRDKQVLENCWVNQIYRMKELVDVDAHKLFCQCAFRGGHLDASYTEVTRKAIKYAHGVPLALQVLGRHLCGRSKEVWESAMRKLEIIPHVDILKVLKISYDSLDDSQKNVFLDIACLLEGEHRDEVTSFFDASGFQAKIELSVLEDKSLITCLNNQIRMHDLLRDMGREIVRNESIDLPGKRSRLWYHKDIDEVLKKNTALRVAAISIENVEYTCGESCFTKMPFSKVEQLWDDVQDLVNLKEIDLCGSKSLTKLPDLSQAKTLETLSLEGCLSLMETHSSIQYLNKLKVLDLGKCKSLTSLPTSIHSKDLKTLILWGCSNLKNFPKITSCHISLLQLGEVGIKELPSSIECLSNLGELLITDCSELESISSSVFKLKSLKYIEISNCSNLKRFLEIPSCNTDGSTGIERLGSCKLVLKECSNIESLPSSLCMFKSLTSLEIVDCQNFKRLPDELGNLEALKTLTVDGTAIREVPKSLGQLPLLYSLQLKKCSELEYISSNIFKLKSDMLIEISNCSNLKRFLEIPSCNTDGSTGIERLGSCELVLKECSNIECLPSSMCMFKSLTSLEIVDCQNFKRLPYELGNFEALSTLTIDGTVIREVPESLGRLPLLYSLQLKKCSELEYITSSIFKLKSDIEISNCSNLKRFLEIPSCNTDGSTGIEWLGSYELVLKECSNIESLPSSLCMFKSLTSLEIVDCQNFKRLPDELGNLEALRTLTVDGTTIREVPESLGQLPLLYSLQLKNCSELEYISSSIFKMKSLESIEISNCSNLKRFLENPSCNTDGGTRIEKLASSRLKLEGCSSLESLPSSLCMFKNLTSLEIIDCQNFKRLPNELGNSKCLTVLIVKGTAIREVPESLEYLRSLPSKLTSHNLSVDLRNCLKLDPNELSEIVKDQWMKQSFDVNFGTTKSMYFPGNEIPKWFRYQTSECFEAVKCVVSCDWKSKPKYCPNGRSFGRIIYVESDHVFLGYYLFGWRDLSTRHDEGYFDEVSFYIFPTYAGGGVKQCGIHFVYAPVSTESREKEEEPHTKRLKCSTRKQLVLLGKKINL
ncbi:ADP-ribosyl cyclase/cyclic ADP-ribose hydrolase [Citrus sinensis]|uniref:ADP-ribosyl cyclase/cyclic ADP-ribose hydrolase n=1 Tax=Citrus sinensis TaxID=2711 RepID=A0ACB8M9F7_CITSI|nr:ADP-ribosyl cyclase/cyclic ADP-ribose hydrolase [Citrus sinensis]